MDDVGTLARHEREDLALRTTNIEDLHVDGLSSEPSCAGLGRFHR